MTYQSLLIAVTQRRKIPNNIFRSLFYPWQLIAVLLCELHTQSSRQNLLLHYEESRDSNASPIVFIHGAGVSSWMWDKQLEYFTHYHCVTVDLPEQGANLHHGEFPIEDSANKIIELIHTFPNKNSVTVVGFSLGAQVLIQVISKQANLIDYAIINSALVKPSKLGKLLIKPLIQLTFPLIKNRAFSRIQAKT